LEKAFKILLKNQLKLSETIIFNCLKLILKELKDFLIILDEEDDEFYDVKSISDTEGEEVYDDSDDNDDNDDDSYDNDDDNDDDSNDDNEDFRLYLLKNDTSSLKSQLKLIPSLTKNINKTISQILEETYEKTRKYLEEYCEMQREMVFCNDPDYIKAFKEYFELGNSRKSKSFNNNTESVDFISTNGYNPNPSCYNLSSSSEDLPLKRIQSESLETLTKRGDESSGFLKEFLALLFPNVKNIQRVEYRPKKRVITLSSETPISKAPISEAPSSEALSSETLSSKTLSSKTTKIKSSSSSNDEEFLLKLLEIYLKSHHFQLKDFIPKCINYHLIQGTLKQLPFKLLKCGKFDVGDNLREEIKSIERILRVIEEINI
jgi:hypothetical protein